MTAVVAKVNEYAKGVVALLGFLATLLATVTPLVPESAQGSVASVLALLTTVSVVLVRNAPKATEMATDLDSVLAELKKLKL